LRALPLPFSKILVFESDSDDADFCDFLKMLRSAVLAGVADNTS
jgi:hypothetical protein